MYEVLLPLVILFCLVFVMVYARKKRHEQSEDFDERQMIFRGVSYKYGFLTMSALNVLFGIIVSYNEKYAAYGVGFLTISFVAGVLVYAIYNVWNDSLLSMRQNRAAYMVLLAVVSVVQFINFFSNPDRTSVSALMSGVAVVQLGCAILFLAIFVTVVVKQIVQGREEEE